MILPFSSGIDNLILTASNRNGFNNKEINLAKEKDKGKNSDLVNFVNQWEQLVQGFFYLSVLTFTHSTEYQCIPSLKN
jgi:hypothetical protein